MKNKGKILIVDDNEEILISLKLFLSNHFDIVDVEKNPNTIPEIIQRQSYDVIILDMNFSAGINSGNEGIYWLSKILEYDPLATVLFITAYGDIEMAVKAIKEGATDFIQKPWDDEKLLVTIMTAVKLRKSNLEIKKLRNKQIHLNENINKSFNMFAGNSPEMKKVFKTIAKVAGTEANILILGENGTGKELIAREIHKQSLRSGEVFVNVDMVSFNEGVFESELFGHVKGAYTDAKEERAGRFEIASGGTLFLDEIGNLTMSMQSKVLAAIQNREIFRIGSNRPITIDIRLISATNKPINEMVAVNTFREDLLYRINTIQIFLPPLRHRIEDIPSLVNHFLTMYSEKYNKEELKVSSKGMDALLKYSFPGNIRELEHMVEKAVILCESGTLKQEDLFFQQNISHAPGKRSFDLEMNEKQLILDALEMHGNNYTKASNELNISRKTLYNKIKKYGF
jgi:Response regulator containing CheY-like receiver, AAA-type ATPase, and DNA-binding domains